MVSPETMLLVMWVDPFNVGNHIARKSQGPAAGARLLSPFPSGFYFRCCVP
jgi:hypothetical protein